jgi:hypothetical protein
VFNGLKDVLQNNDINTMRGGNELRTYTGNGGAWSSSDSDCQVPSVTIVAVDIFLKLLSCTLCLGRSWQWVLRVACLS